MTAASPMKRYLQALRPPWRGCFNVVAGMTWARSSIFFGSDRGRQWLQRSGYNPWVASTLPPALISAFVQVVNQPFTRASVTLQNPACGTCRSAWLPSLLILQQLVEARGVAALWHGMSPAILKTVPKYVTAVTARDMLENQLPPAGSSEASLLLRSATKSVMAALRRADKSVRRAPQRDVQERRAAQHCSKETLAGRRGLLVMARLWEKPGGRRDAHCEHNLLDRCLCLPEVRVVQLFAGPNI
eukprot:CAMPEP_0115164146 /NCGR_PEP_ID=MMETSP0227-20121206/72876_1 /TAXON_ID=89957 /ORGANISM="Polarella glacialis, Strain CCMP 1383" /LENGTH=243 /DNA_ID=CAMNT_0002576477 /DNA_START=33 /DNA_END=764 /DNA_ORIENTATION=-